MASYLLLETGDKLILEDASGDLLLELNDQNWLLVKNLVIFFLLVSAVAAS